MGNIVPILIRNVFVTLELSGIVCEGRLVIFFSDFEGGATTLFNISVLTILTLGNLEHSGNFSFFTAAEDLNKRITISLKSYLASVEYYTSGRILGTLPITILSLICTDENSRNQVVY